MKKKHRKPEPIGDHVRKIDEAQWEIMEAIGAALSDALAAFGEKYKAETGEPGIRTDTLFMAIHNHHKLVLLNMAQQLDNPNPSSRAEFYAIARDTFVRGMDAMIAACESEARIRRVERIPLVGEAD